MEGRADCPGSTVTRDPRRPGIQRSSPGRVGSEGRIRAGLRRARSWIPLQAFPPRCISLRQSPNVQVPCTRAASRPAKPQGLALRAGLGYFTPHVVLRNLTATAQTPTITVEYPTTAGWAPPDDVPAPARVRLLPIGW